jgi:hypothetical protein
VGGRLGQARGSDLWQLQPPGRDLRVVALDLFHGQIGGRRPAGQLSARGDREAEELIRGPLDDVRRVGPVLVDLERVLRQLLQTFVAGLLELVSGTCGIDEVESCRYLLGALCVGNRLCIGNDWASRSYE